MSSDSADFTSSTTAFTNSNIINDLSGGTDSLWQTITADWSADTLQISEEERNLLDQRLVAYLCSDSARMSPSCDCWAKKKKQMIIDLLAAVGESRCVFHCGSMGCGSKAQINRWPEPALFKCNLNAAVIQTYWSVKRQRRCPLEMWNICRGESFPSFLSPSVSLPSIALVCEWTVCVFTVAKDSWGRGGGAPWLPALIKLTLIQFLYRELNNSMCCDSVYKISSVSSNYQRSLCFSAERHACLLHCFLLVDQSEREEIVTQTNADVSVLMY